jgi:hypothetical protein
VVEMPQGLLRLIMWLVCSTGSESSHISENIQGCF